MPKGFSSKAAKMWKSKPTNSPGPRATGDGEWRMFRKPKQPPKPPPKQKKQR